MTELKIEDVKVGDELICIDRDGFLDADICAREMLDFSDFKVIEINNNGVQFTRDNRIYLNCLLLESLKYFKKKEQPQQYTFDDLIDVAVQAYKDGKLNISDMSYKITVSNYGDLGVVESIYKKDTSKYKCFADFIQSLYKETFVIETEDDIQKIQAHRKSDLPLLDEQMSKAILENGNEILIFRVDSESPHVCRYMRNGLYMNYLDIEVLKGATVEQERGRDE